MKKEYEKFKGRTNFILILFSLILLLFPETKILSVAFQVWSLYYYVTLALREHILKVNGSNIKPWWIWHHYVSILVAISWLTWSFSSSFRNDVRPMFYFLMIWQGFVQCLMHRYQQYRLYEMVAIGKAKKIDVTGELLAPQYVPSLFVLLPFILSMQGFILYVAYGSIKIWLNHSNAEWQIVASGTLLAVLACGNLYTTVFTYWQKFELLDPNLIRYKI